MEDARSKSYNNEKSVHIETTYTQVNDKSGVSPHHKSSGMQDLRCYSASYAPAGIAAADGGGEQWKFKKGKSTSGVDSKNWSFNDPELQRKKRVASYKAYSVEGKVKGSFKKSFKWIRERYTLMVYGHV